MHDGDVVQGQDALLGHAIGRRERHLRGKPPDRPRGGNRKETAQQRDGGLTGEDEMGAPTKLRILCPPDLAAVHQGSAAIDRRPATSASASSSPGGMRR